MKKKISITLSFGILLSAFILLSSFETREIIRPPDHSLYSEPEEKLKEEAFKILDAKCNICHKKKNPFMVFNKKNMVRRASKIYKAVFIRRRMPKGNEIRLTTEEYSKLEKWLKIAVVVPRGRYSRLHLNSQNKIK